ncbi:MAG: hypothetical protein ACHQEM_01750 [Chitinophagales bacterium]
MRIIQVSGFFFLGIFFCSCNKDGGQFTYNATYHKAGLKVGGDLRLFSTFGEINDPLLLSKFNHEDSSNFFLFANYIATNTQMMDSIRFPDPLNVKLLLDYSWVNCQVSQHVDRLVLTRTDTTSAINSGDLFSASLPYYLCQYKPVIFEEWLISSTRGDYEFGYSSKEKYAMRISGGQLSAPIIEFHSVHQGGFYFHVNNYLQEDFYKNISVGDTVSLRYYYIQYEK